MYLMFDFYVMLQSVFIKLHVIVWKTCGYVGLFVKLYFIR